MAETKTKHPGGRPSKYTKALGESICAELAVGKSLGTVCKAEGMPAVQTIFNWFRVHPEFLELYTRAKEEAADFMAEYSLDIVDDARNDYMQDEYMKGKTPGYQLNGENIQRSRLRFEARKWLMAKYKPKKYGDKIDMTTNGKDLPAPILSLEELRKQRQEG